MLIISLLMPHNSLAGGSLELDYGIYLESQMRVQITRYYWGVGVLVTCMARHMQKLCSTIGAMVVVVTFVWPTARKSITGVIVVGSIKWGQVR